MAAKAVPTLKRTVKPVIAQKTGKTGAAQSLKAKPRASVATPATLAPVKRVRTDWDAVERDYRTGKFTLRELGARHGISYAQISRKAGECSWTKDLQQVIRQATNAALLHDTVTKAQKNVTETVLVAAELNKQVILGHRTRLADLAGDVATAKQKLMEIGKKVVDIREAATFVQAVGNLATATKTLIDQERKAFGLDDEDAGRDKSDPLGSLLVAMNRSSLPIIADPEE